MPTDLGYSLTYVALIKHYRRKHIVKLKNAKQKCKNLLWEKKQLCICLSICYKQLMNNLLQALYIYTENKGLNMVPKILTNYLKLQLVN